MPANGTLEEQVRQRYHCWERAILRLFQERGLPFTCWAVGLALSRNPDAGRAMAEAGHKVASHSWCWIDYAGMAEAQEREDIRKTVQAIQAITGSPPLG